MNLNLRPATIADAEMLLAWRNDPETRAASRNTGEVKLADHLAWLERVLKDEHRHLFVFEVEGTPVGSIRADDEASGTELSWTVAQDQRGHGYGKLMLSELLKHPVLLGKKVWAAIKKDNPGSKKMVEDLGFVQTRDSADGLSVWTINC